MLVWGWGTGGMDYKGREKSVGTDVQWGWFTWVCICQNLPDITL